MRDEPNAPQPPACRLSQLALHETAQVLHLAGVAGDSAGGDTTERLRHLAEIGFTAGERVSVLARAWPGGDPMVVGVGHSRFALRRAEADCVWVQA